MWEALQTRLQRKKKNKLIIKEVLPLISTKTKHLLWTHYFYISFLVLQRKGNLEPVPKRVSYFSSPSLWYKGPNLPQYNIELLYNASLVLFLFFFYYRRFELYYRERGESWAYCRTTDYIVIHFVLGQINNYRYCTKREREKEESSAVLENSAEPSGMKYSGPLQCDILLQSIYQGITMSDRVPLRVKGSLFPAVGWHNLKIMIMIL